MKRRRRRDPPFSLFAFQDIITSVTGVLLLMTLLITLTLITRELDSPRVQSLELVQDLSPVLAKARDEIDDLHRRLERGERGLAAVAAVSKARLRRDVHNITQQVENLRSRIRSLEQKLEQVKAAREHWRSRESAAQEDQRRVVELTDELQELEERLNRIRREDRLIYNPQQSAGKHAWLVDVGQGQLVAARMNVAERPRTFGGTKEFVRWARSRDARREYFVLLVRPKGIETYRLISERLSRSSFDLGVDLLGEGQTVMDPEHGLGDPT